MKWAAATLSAAWTLCCWTVLFFLLTPLHRLLFLVTPTGYSDRPTVDGQIAHYLLYGHRADLAALTQPEQAHLADVRTVWFFLGVFVVLLGAAGLIAHRIRRLASATARLAENARAGRIILVLGLGSLVCFEPLFELLHRLFFPGGNWQFVASSVLIRTYPLAFFAWSWVLIVAASYLTMRLPRLADSQHERA